VPRKIVSRATLGTRAIGSPALIYAIPAWWGFASKGDRQRLGKLLAGKGAAIERRGFRHGRPQEFFQGGILRFPKFNFVYKNQTAKC